MNTLENTVIEHPFLKTMREDHLARLLKNVREKDFHRGEIVFRRGDPANCFYLIQSGKIVIEAQSEKGPVPIQEITSGEALGWSWLLPPFSWHFQARAIEPTHAIVLDGAHLLVTAEQDTEFGYALMKRIAKILIQRLQVGAKRYAQGVAPKS